MSEFQPSDTTETMPTEALPSNGSLPEQISEMKPADTTETIPTEVPPSNGSSPNQITESDPTDSRYSNTSNDNQIAVLSTIDYSTVTNNLDSSHKSESSSSSSSTTNTNNTTTDSSSSSSSTTNTNNTTTDSSNHNTSITNYYFCPIPASLDPATYSSTTNNYHYYTTNNISEPPTTGTNTPNPELITGSTNLARNAIHFRFESREYFSRSGIRRVDQIIGFNPSIGDRLEFSRKIFKGISSMDIEIAANRKQRRSMAKSSADIIYQESSGKLFFNANGEEKGFGKSGGMFAILEGSPLISSSNLTLI